MADPRRRHARRSGIVWPLILIVIGSIFLLQNLGLLAPTAWLNLWRLWPLLLVLIGLDLLLAQRRSMAILLGLVVSIFALGLVAGMVAVPGLSAPRPATSGAVTSRVQTQTLRGATQAAVTLRFGAGQLDVGPLHTGGPDDLASMTYDGPPGPTPEAQYSVTNGTGRLSYQLSGRDGFLPFFGNRGSAESHLNLMLRPDLPLSLAVQTGATQARLDLSQLRVNNLDVSMGAADTWVRLPENAGTTTNAHFSGGATSLTLEIPNGVAAQIRTRGGLNTVSVDQSRFPTVGNDLYRSPDFATARNKVDITVETGVSTIRVS